VSLAPEINGVRNYWGQEHNLIILHRPHLLSNSKGCARLTVTHVSSSLIKA
jgi:hypothetical protein